eukprot:283409-Amphidinium_carterae.1
MLPDLVRLGAWFIFDNLDPWEMRGSKKGVEVLADLQSSCARCLLPVHEGSWEWYLSRDFGVRLLTVAQWFALFRPGFCGLGLGPSKWLLQRTRNSKLRTAAKPPARSDP